MCKSVFYPVHLLFLFTLLGFSAGSFAAEDPATELIELTNSKQTFRAAFMVGFKPFLDRLAKNDKVKATQIQEVKQAALDFADKIHGDKTYKESVRKLYLSHFSQAELGELVRFYRTPIGKKALQKLPLLFQEAGQIGNRLAQKHISSFQAQIKRILEPAKGATKAQ